MHRMAHIQNALRCFVNGANFWMLVHHPWRGQRDQAELAPLEEYNHEYLNPQISCG